MKKILALVLCLIFVLSLAACGGGNNSAIDLSEEDELAGTSDTYSTVDIDASVTYDAYNMLTGISDMASDRVGKRIYAISVNNIQESWPQKGTYDADVILEMETEGGISRLMCLYSDVRDVPLVGSVRSLRDQFLEAIFPLDPVLVHIGMSTYAEKAVNSHNFRTIDGDYIPKAIYVDREKMRTYATEHCKFTSASLIVDAMDVAKIDDASSCKFDSLFNFVEAGTEPITGTGGTANTVNYDFSTGYDGDFRYDEASGQYLKWQHGQKQEDAQANKQLAFDNVILLFADIEVRADGLIIVDYLNGGTGYYFTHGTYEEFTWEKGDYSNNFKFTKADGSELQVNTGKTHMGIIRNTLKDSLEIA